MTKLTPAATYRQLASELREAALAKTDQYARAALKTAAQEYDRLAEQIDRVNASGRAMANGHEARDK